MRQPLTAPKDSAKPNWRRYKIPSHHPRTHTHLMRPSLPRRRGRRGYADPHPKRAAAYIADRACTASACWQGHTKYRHHHRAGRSFRGAGCVHRRARRLDGLHPTRRRQLHALPVPGDIRRRRRRPVARPSVTRGDTRCAVRDATGDRGRKPRIHARSRTLLRLDIGRVRRLINPNTEYLT